MANTEPSCKSIIDGIDAALDHHFYLSAEDVQVLLSRNLSETSCEIMLALRRAIPANHPLKKIAVGALKSLITHIVAIDRLGNSNASLVHVRHVEEVTTTLEYLVADPQLYSEYEWRWNSFLTVTGIRNRLFNLKQPLHPSMTKWVSDNINQLRSVDSKFSNDIVKDRKIWESYVHWLYPRSLKKIFDASGQRDSYLAGTYDWHSQDVHLSPLSGRHRKIGLPPYLGNYFEFAVLQLEHDLHKLCTIFEIFSTSSRALKILHLKLILLELKRLIINHPDLFSNNMKNLVFSQRMKVIVDSPRDLNALSIALLGKSI